MKKNLLIMFYGLLIAMAITNQVRAQSSFAAIIPSKDALSAVKDFAAADNNDLGNYDMAKENASSEKAKLKAVKAGNRAAAHFNKEFAGVDNVQWIAGSEVIEAIFKKDKVQTHAVYTKQGNWLHTLMFYSESKMPAELKDQIDASYPGYAINIVEEVKEGDLTFHIVHLESKTELKLICAYKGELEVYKEYKKQQ